MPLTMLIKLFDEPILFHILTYYFIINICLRATFKYKKKHGKSYNIKI